MSDNSGIRFISGNLTGRWDLERHMDKNISSDPSKNALVEEALSVNMRDLQQIHGQQKLLRAADEGKPISVRLGELSFDVYLSWEPHRLPGKIEKWSDISQGNCRIYIVCPSCRRKIRILYRNPRPLLPYLPPIGCRRCLHLIYASQHSGKTKWWKQIVRPLRRFYRLREKLLSLNRTRRIAEQLKHIEELIFVYSQRAKPKRQTGRLSGNRRQYKDIRLILGLR
jgi:hypothetical protein